MWEHCIKYNDSKKEPEGEFTMKDVRMGLSLRDFKKSPIGWIDVKLDLCPYWHLFAQQGIEGASYDAKNERMSMFLPHDPQGDQTQGFGCSFEAKDVFDVAYQMCSPSLLQKVRFCYKDGERWADIPDIDVKPAKKSKPKARAAEIPQHTEPAEPTFAEKLREALLRQFRQAA